MQQKKIMRKGIKNPTWTRLKYQKNLMLKDGKKKQQKKTLVNPS